jgi:hypothetical protein
MCRWASPNPSEPIGRENLDQVGQALAAALGSLCDLEVSEPAGLVQRCLCCGPAYSGQGGDPIDRQVANAMVLHLTGQYA